MRMRVSATQLQLTNLHVDGGHRRRQHQERTRSTPRSDVRCDDRRCVIKRRGRFSGSAFLSGPGRSSESGHHPSPADDSDSRLLRSDDERDDRWLFCPSFVFGSVQVAVENPAYRVGGSVFETVIDVELMLAHGPWTRRDEGR